MELEPYTTTLHLLGRTRLRVEQQRGEAFPPNGLQAAQGQSHFRRGIWHISGERLKRQVLLLGRSSTGNDTPSKPRKKRRCVCTLTVLHLRVCGNRRISDACSPSQFAVQLRSQRCIRDVAGRRDLGARPIDQHLKGDTDGGCSAAVVLSTRALRAARTASPLEMSAVTQPRNGTRQEAQPLPQTTSVLDLVTYSGKIQTVLLTLEAFP